MATPEESTDVRIARLEERTRTQFSLLSEIKRDLEELKGRRMPGGIMAAISSAVAATAAVISVMHR